MVSTLRCGRSNPGSNPGHGKLHLVPLQFSQISFFFTNLTAKDSLRAFRNVTKYNRILIIELCQVMQCCLQFLPTFITLSLYYEKMSHKIVLYGLVAQWITRLTTDQKILGSTPG